MTKTLTVRGQRVRSASQRRFVAVRLVRRFDGVQYSGDFVAASIEKRSDSIATLKTWIGRQGFHSSRMFVVIDTTTGEEV